LKRKDLLKCRSVLERRFEDSPKRFEKNWRHFRVHAYHARVPDIESHDYRRFAVLIIEPDESVRLSFRRTLGEKFWILEARSDKEALALLKRQTEGVGVIVRDELLPPTAADTEALTTIVADYPKTVRVLSGHEDLIGKAVALKSEMDAEENSTVVSDSTSQQVDPEASVEFSDEGPAAQGGHAVLDQATVLFQNRNRVFYVTRPWDMGQLEATLSRAMELFVVGHERDQWRNAHHGGAYPTGPLGAGVPAPYPTVPMGAGAPAPYPTVPMGAGVPVPYPTMPMGGMPAPYPTIPMAVNVGPDGQPAFMPTIMAMPGVQIAATAPVSAPNGPTSVPLKPASGNKPPEKDQLATAQTPPDLRAGQLEGGEALRPVPSDRPQLPFWKKLGGGSLSISLIIHGVILAVGLIFIIQVIPAPKKPPVDFMPSSGGGGDPSTSSKVKSKQRTKAMSSAAPRVAAKDVASGFTLPEPVTGDMSALPSLSGGAMSGGLGGSGSGGGKGTGTGQGFGTGAGIGMGNGTGKMNPFGMLEPANNALVGTFYDLKQNKNGKPTELGEATKFEDVVSKYRSEMHTFTKRGWNERELAGYFQAPQKLYQTKIFMPTMGADGAPKAFGQNSIAGSRWVVVYRGSVMPPKTGKYRFVGAGDDVLAVRFAGKNVFDYGYESATGNISLAANKNKLEVTAKDRDWERVSKDVAMPHPMQIYRYGSLHPRHSNDILGLAVGLEFEAQEGTSYPIEILIGETPGGFFFGYLLIEEIGAQYQKDPSGSPILPLFRLDNNPPAVPKPGPPFDPNGPVWKLGGARGKMSI
jgi:hypothetical protein